jgi:undecaprenyl-diphosphatase
MHYFEAIILGVVQGITEFLPISSSGHLILARELLGIESEYGLAVDATLHFATACAVILYFRKDILRLVQTAYALVCRRATQRADRTLLFALALGTIPAVVFGLLFEDTIDTAFRSAELVAWVLLAGSALFLLAEWVLSRYRENTQLTVGKSICIGFFQALALIPGMSRSGATMSSAMLLGMSRADAARFAFLLSVPIILGAGGLKFLELSVSEMGAGEWGMVGLATLSAFLSGLLCIHYLLKYLKDHTLMVFVVYRVALAMVVLAMVG